jgi:hypothetical protein
MALPVSKLLAVLTTTFMLPNCYDADNGVECVVEKAIQRRDSNTRSNTEDLRWDQSCRRGDESYSPRRPKIKPVAWQTQFLRYLLTLVLVHLYNLRCPIWLQSYGNLTKSIPSLTL